MILHVTSGIGEGPTPLAAFDAALLNAGVANYNLIYLSSIIPPGSELRRGKYVTPEAEYGDRLYVVMARHEADQLGEAAWAGVGWTQEAATGRGLLVEIHGGDQGQVVGDIHATLETMIAGRPLAYGPIQHEVAGVTCQGRPVCALVIVVFQREAWAPG